MPSENLEKLRHGHSRSNKNSIEKIELSSLTMEQKLSKLRLAKREFTLGYASITVGDAGEHEATGHASA